MLRKASQAFVILVCLRCALPTAADLACTPFDITIGKCAVIRDPFGTRLCILDMTKGARPSNLTSITLLSRIVYFLRKCGVAIGTVSGRSQQPRPDRCQDLLQRQTRSFFLPQGRWSG